MEYKQYTSVELEMMADDFEKFEPAKKRVLQSDAVLLFARYQALIKEGFTPEDALEIIKARGSNV